MATISLSNKLKNATLIWLTTDSSSDARGLTAAGSGMNIHAAMYSGTAPTGFGDLDNNNSIPSGTAILWSSSSSSSSGIWTTPTVTNGGTDASATFTSSFTTASASGTASWFRIWTNNQTAHDSASSMATFGQIVGTIGTSGSGADLILPATNIVSGKSYKIDGLKLQLATDYTY